MCRYLALKKGLLYATLDRGQCEIPVTVGITLLVCKLETLK